MPSKNLPVDKPRGMAQDLVTTGQGAGVPVPIDFAADIAIVQGLGSVSAILALVCQSTGMGFAAVARVTEDRWIACSVHDGIDFGMEAGGELKVETTICHEVRAARELVVIDHVAQDDVYRDHHTPALYGFQSYISVPIFLPDGSLFGTLCAIDPAPRRIDTPETRAMFASFATLIGHQIQAAHAIEDRTAELRRTEDALRQSQKMDAIGQLTGGVAHDFNNLLTVIRGSVDVLRRPDLAEEKRQRYVSAIGDTADRAIKLTGQLLAFARRSALQPETFDAGHAIVAVKEMVGTLTGSRIRIEVETPSDALFVLADPSQFDTALVNLIVNARDAMAGEGRLAIRVERCHAIPPVRGHGTVVGDYVAIAVTDTGAGIPPETIERIFEPFYTTKPVGAGTGLGLSQVFGFAKQSDGEIRAESVPGQGATFILYLPVADAPAPPPAEPERPADTGPLSVLVVDDNGDVGRFARDSLAELGHHARWVAHAREALQELQARHGQYDAVFSDVVMPGMNGIDLAAEIRRLYPDLPVVLTSGYSHALAEHGCKGFDLLHKPYSIAQLVAALGKAVVRAELVD